MIFIVGVGRSGTSLLQSMLNSHPEIVFIPEINFIRRFLTTNALEKLYAKQGRAGLLEFLSADELIGRLQLDIGSTFSGFDFDSPDLALCIYRTLLTAYAGRESDALTGDKDPRSIEHLPLLNRLFPECKIIHVIRDPRDVLVSKMKADWSKSRPWYLHVLINKIQLSLGKRHAPLFDDRYFEIHYEQLLQEPQQELEKLCRFLNVSFEKQMLDFAASSQSLVSEQEMQWKKETLGPLLNRNFNKWRTHLTPLQVALVEKNVNPAFEYYGYEKSAQRLNFFQAVLAKLSRPVYALGAALYRLK